MSIMALQFLLIGSVFLLGWIVPLVMGVRRSRRGQGGLVLLIAGGVWGLLAIGAGGLAGLGVYVAWNADRAWEAGNFDPATYEGETGQLTLALPGKAKLWVREADGATRWHIESSNDVVTVPAIPLQVERIHWQADDDAGLTWILASSSLQGSWQKIDLQPGEKLTYPVGRQMSAAVKVSRQNDLNYGIDLTMRDEHGNRFSLSSSGSKRKPLGFEGVDASNRVVWRGNFEYG